MPITKKGTGYINIGEDIAGSEYDAATVNLGNGWRLPTKVEYEELLNNCTWTYGQVEGVDGYFVVGKNGNSIFLPKKGEYYETTINSGLFDEFNPYCSSTLYNSEQIYCLNFERDLKKEVKATNRYSGLQIRPVYSPSSPGGITNITDYITINRTGMGTTVSSGGTRYTVTFEISNKSTETIYLNTLAGVDISENLEGGKSYTITLQSTTAALQNYKQTLIFTYNGKKYEIKG